MSGASRPNAAVRPVLTSAVSLVREGDYAVVSVEFPDRPGVWYEIMREHVDSNFSHITEASGIRSRRQGS